MKKKNQKNKIPFGDTSLGDSIGCSIVILAIGIVVFGLPILAAVLGAIFSPDSK